MITLSAASPLEVFVMFDGCTKGLQKNGVFSEILFKVECRQAHAGMGMRIVPFPRIGLIFFPITQTTHLGPVFAC
jgi:hypothetical protein